MTHARPGENIAGRAVQRTLRAAAAPLAVGATIDTGGALSAAPGRAASGPGRAPMSAMTLVNDDNLERATEVEGYKVLPPCVLYGKIGQGGMGAVYRGRHLNLDIDVAVKCLKPGLVGSDDQFVVRFRREARSAAQINHQNVIRVYDVAEDQGLHYLIMELVQGETARERVVRKKQLSIGEALEIVYGASLGLAEAHRKGFIHRDIKPDNIMISSGGQVKVADLGLAKPSIREDNASMLSGTNLVMGTPQYMPPEQWENTTNVTAAADVWALGATLYYLLVGGEAIQKDSLPRIMQRIMLQPFPDPRRARPDVPEDVAALIAKATATAVQDRYQDAQQLADAIEALHTRRAGLKDKDAVSTSRVDSLVSPPPAKTLAKIKFWLDKQGQPISPSAATQGPGGTMVVSGAPEPLASLAPRKSARNLWLAGTGIVLALVAAIAIPWSGRRPSGIFAEADRLELFADYEGAIAEALRVHTEDPSLLGKAERLARLRASWARALAARNEGKEALAQMDASLALLDTPAGRKQQKELVEKIATGLESKLVRESPTTAPVADPARVEFVGRLDDPVVSALRIGGSPATLQSGSFRVLVDTSGRNQIPVEVTLTSGDVVSLGAWPVVHASRPETLEPAAMSITPEVIEFDDDQESELVVRVAAGATVAIDGVVQQLVENGTVARHRVRSTEDTPRPISVVVRQAGFAETSRTVPTRRAAKSWSWIRPLELPGCRQLGAQFVTKEATVRLVGRPSEQGSVHVNGTAVEVRWTNTGSFECDVPLPGNGVNMLRVEVRKRLRPAPLNQDVTVVRVGDPTLDIAAPSRDGETTTAATYGIALTIDPWTIAVTARRGGMLVKTVDIAPGATVARVEVGLLNGANEFDLEAVNVVGLRRTRKFTVNRGQAGPGGGNENTPVTPPSELPEIESVFVALPTGERLVAKNYLRVPKGTRFRVVLSKDAVLLCRDKEVREDELVLAPDSPLIVRGVLELRARNDVGLSKDPLKFRVFFDDTAPTIEVKAPPGPVGSGVKFRVQGKWADPGGGVESITVNGLPATGANPRSEGQPWSIELPGITETTEYEVVCVDEAGNTTRTKFTVSP